MVFSSLIFLFRFLPAVLTAYYIMPRQLRNFVLFLFSLIFYAWGEPVYSLLMLVSIFIAYIGGLLIDKFMKIGQSKKAKATLIISSIFSLSLLAFFKYFNFALSTLNKIFGTSFFPLCISLPIGISFYTFQALSYIIDVYRGDADVQKNFISFGTYISMFPQLIAGPIVRYSTIDKQLRSRNETVEQFAQGIKCFVIGLGKKVLLANNIGLLWDSVKNISELPLLSAWLGLAAFTFQIYFDFSGYSDMAVGLGYMFGFSFPANFNYPYVSKSITEFWHRWHISLSTWFREYVYIPLGGNRVNKIRHVRNILIVWFLTGLWHGASWNFAIWGLYYAVLLLSEKFIFCGHLERLPSIFRYFYCMFFVMLGWNIFAFDDVKLGLDFIKSLFGLNGRGFVNGETIFLVYNNFLLLIFCAIGSTELPNRLVKRINERFLKNEFVILITQNILYVAILLLSTAWLIDTSFNPFLYFRF